MAPEKTDPESETVNTSTVSEDGESGAAAESNEHHDPYFEPVVTLPEIQVKTNEEEEEEMIKLRCKLFRFSTAETPGEWKERGTGDVKILRHGKKKTVRLLMRQDKTLKIRANHYISPFMELKPNCGSDRAWVWSVPADFADEEPKRELFAVKFANAENARTFKEMFDEARGIVSVAAVGDKSESDDKNSPEKATTSKTEEKKSSNTSLDKSTEDVTKQMDKIAIKTE